MESSFNKLIVQIPRSHSTNSGTIEAKINDRINSATKVYHALNNVLIRKQEVSEKTKVSV